MASQSGVFNVQQFTDAGALLVAGRLYTYDYGTTTHKVAYTDAAGTVPQTYTADGIGGQYIAINARGELAAPLYLAAGSYDIALKRFDGSTVWTRRADPTDVPASTLRSDIAAPSGASLVGSIASAVGAITRTQQSKNDDGLSVFDFLSAAQKAYVKGGAVATGMDAAIAVAISSAHILKQRLTMNAGDWYTVNPIALTTTDWLIGEGKDSTKIRYSGAGSGIICSAWGGKVAGLSVLTSNPASNGIEVGNNSRNCSIEDFYAQMTGSAALATGAGIYLNAGMGFSGGIEIRTSYVLAFKYGCLMRGTDTGFNTWTTVSLYNFWALGNSSATVVGSAGIYMDSKTNGIGTCMFGGTLESFNTAVFVEEGSAGGVFETDMEGNTNAYNVGTSFNGRIVSAFGVPSLQRAGNGTGGAIWFQERIIDGGSPITEHYYPDKHCITNVSGGQQLASITYLNPSIVQGAALSAQALKFQVGIGSSSAYGITDHPSNHFLQLCEMKLSWGPDIPSSRLYGQDVVWSRGSICFNSAPSVGAPKGWVCTVAGTGTTGTINSGSAALTVAAAGTITNGQNITVDGAGAAGAPLYTTVTAGGGTTSLTLALAAGTSVVSAAVRVPGTWVSQGNL